MRAIDLERDEIRRLEARGERPRSRFENAVATLEDFVRGRKYDRIGMVVFAKNAFLQFPLTLDYNTILNMLGRLELGDIDEGGTAIGNALGRAIGGLAESEAETKIIILITDGDRRGGNISPMKAAELAAREDIKIYPILVGKSGETLVPVGRNLLSRRLSYREMKFPVDPELLKKIAEETGGSYYRATEPESLRDGLHVILDRYERSRLRDDTNVEYDENYVAFAWWAVLLLAAAFALEHTWLRRFP
jgi:Ca-activated chloride channel family protein